MRGIFNYDNPVWIFLGRIWDMIYLTLLWSVCSLPILTAGASTTALFTVALRLVRGHEAEGVTRGFFKAFKENFKQSTLIWLIVLIVGALLALNIRFYLTRDDDFSRLFIIVMFVFTGFFLLISQYLFPVAATFDTGIKKVFLFSFYYCIRNFGWSILMLTIAVCVMALSLFKVAALLVISIGGIAYLQSMILVHVFPYKEDNEGDTVSNDD